MKVIGITGPTGAGKTTALRVLRSFGVKIIDADAVYHDLLESSSELWEGLLDRFGGSILDQDGKIDRKKLSQAVYPNRLEELNALTHPIIVREVWARVEEARRAGLPAAAIDAIALMECGLGAKCDAVVAVVAPLELRIRRVMARDGVDEDYARRRALAQQSESFFRERADYVLENGEEDTPEAFAERARALFSQLLEAP